MKTYVCAELERSTNIYGGHDCAIWVEQTTLIDELEITKQDASEITIAIVGLLFLAYVGGLIGRAMMQV